MKVTFKKNNFELSCNCELMAKSENPIILDFHLKTEEKEIVGKYSTEIEEAEKVLIYEEDDGVEYSILTVAVVDICEQYSIIRINCKPLGVK
jgi:hypothetical protein